MYYSRVWLVRVFLILGTTIQKAGIIILHKHIMVDPIHHTQDIHKMADLTIHPKDTSSTAMIWIFLHIVTAWLALSPHAKLQGVEDTHKLVVLVSAMVVKLDFLLGESMLLPSVEDPHFQENITRSTSLNRRHRSFLIFFFNKYFYNIFKIFQRFISTHIKLNSLSCLFSKPGLGKDI